MTGLSRLFSRAACAAAALATAMVLVPVAASAQESATITGRVQPGIWIDPDGCMHWVADGGVEGYMEGRVNPHDGMPICLDVNTCAVTNSDVLFHTDSARLTHLPDARRPAGTFFRSRRAPSTYAILTRPHPTAARRDEIQTCSLSPSVRAAPVANCSPARSAPRVAGEIGYGRNAARGQRQIRRRRDAGNPPRF